MFDFVFCWGKNNSTLVSNYFNLPIIGLEKPLCQFKRIIIVCPTYGDAEILPDVEIFLKNFNIRKKEYALCELGNYFGFEWNEFGAATIIKKHLNNLDWKLIFPVLSLDSIPKVDFECLKNWKEELFLKF